MNQEAPREVPVYVVLPPRTLLLDVAGPIEVLRRANVEQNRLCFVFHYVGAAQQIGTSIGLKLTDIQAMPDMLPDNAIVMVSGNISEPPESDPQLAKENANQTQKIVNWLRRSIRPSIRLVLICSGALLAAQAGLLDGYECTTHYACCSRLAALAPAVHVLENRLFVEDGERFSSAGVTAGIDLMLHMLAQMCGSACALAVARYLVVYMRRGGADPQLSPWLEGRNHVHLAIHRVQDAVAADPARSWRLSDLAAIAVVSARHLSRLFNEHSGMSITDYINRMRVALAHEMLASSRLDIERVAERSGFASTRQFRRAWNRLHSLPPSKMRGEGA